MPLLNFNFFLSNLTVEDKQILASTFCFKRDMIAQERDDLLEKTLVSVNYLLNDFTVKRGPYRLGKTKDRIKNLKQEIESLKQNPISSDLKMNEDWIKYKEEWLDSIQPFKTPRVENQALIEWLKEKTFAIYDKSHPDYFKKIESNRKRREVCYFINKAAFVSKLNYCLSESFYGYADICAPISWETENWAKSILENYKDTSAYRDARKFTLVSPTQAHFFMK